LCTTIFCCWTYLSFFEPFSRILAHCHALPWKLSLWVFPNRFSQDLDIVGEIGSSTPSSVHRCFIIFNSIIHHKACAWWLTKNRHLHVMLKKKWFVSWDWTLGVKMSQTYPSFSCSKFITHCLLVGCISFDELVWSDAAANLPVIYLSVSIDIPWWSMN
jgi:hypothetical protein